VPELADEVGEWERHLCAPVTDGLVIVAFELLAGMTGLVADLRRWGARSPLLLADGRGTGPVPGPRDAHVHMLPTPDFESVTEQVRSRMRPADRLTPDVVAAVEAYDPGGQAVWWMSPLGLNSELLGRKVLGGRPPGQAVLEDKLMLDGLLDAIEAGRSIARVCPARLPDLLEASAEVRAEAGSDGVVWAGDARDGINGGGDFVRWVRTHAHAAQAADFFASRCDRVRVSPFLEGVPCSIHGIVLPDGVTVLRPVELATLHQPQRGRFLYAGMGTSWEPPVAEAEEMRRLARRLGEHLRALVGYRGGFGLDGVLTTDGFRATELNPRFSGGLTGLGRAAPAANLDLVQLNALIGRDIAKPAAELEAESLGLLAANRFAHVTGISPDLKTEKTVEVDVGLAPAELGPGATPREATPYTGDEAVETPQLRLVDTALTSDTPVVGTVVRGPSPVGTFVRLVLAPGRLRTGDRAGSFAVLLHDFADRTWATGFGPAEVAPDVTVRRPADRPRP
jgi:hypothetical protein